MLWPEKLNGSYGQDKWHGTRGFTPPVVPGAAPALAEAGVGGLLRGKYDVEEVLF